MSLHWNAPVSKATRLMRRDLRFYGITFGWFGIGILRGIDPKGEGK